MKRLSNDYKECHVINLDPETLHGPLVVTQEAYDPEDPEMRMTIFLLKRDGFWIDELAHFATHNGDRFEIIFDGAAEVIELLSTLLGEPKVERRDVTTPELQAFITTLRGGGMAERVRIFLQRYRASKLEH